MGSVLKGIGKAVKGIFKGIKKVFSAVGKAVSKIFGSKLGKILLVAAAIFTGGAALGLWATPFATAAGTAGAGVGMNAAAGMTAGTAGVSTAAAGAFEGLGMIGASGAAGATGAAGVGGFSSAALGGGQLTSAAAPGFLAEAAGGTVGTTVGANTGLAVTNAAVNSAGLGTMLTPLSASSNAAITAGTSTAISGAAPAAGGLWGTIGKVVSGVEGWMSAHPALTTIGGNMLASMFKEDPYDKYADAQIKMKEWERDNSTIAGVRYDGSGTPIDLNQMGLQDIAQRHAAQAPQPQQVAYQPTPYIPAPLPQDPSKTGLLAKYYGAA
jgi:hypothetical protein